MNEREWIERIAAPSMHEGETLPLIKPTKHPVVARLEEMDSGALLLEPREQFDHCLVGIVERFHDTFALYSRTCVLAAIQADIKEEDHGPEDDPATMAREHYEFNIIGGWVGDGTPAFLIEEDE